MKLLKCPVNGLRPVQEFDTLTLHGFFNDHWLWVGAPATMQRDQWCRDAQNVMGGYGPHGTYVHLYLNGLYWGLYDIGEKGDASYAAHYLGGDPEEYDAFNSDELIDGDANAWNAMFGIANAGITNDVAYTNLAQYLNIPNFIDYMTMNFYAANGDWPWHNWNAARRRLPRQASPGLRAALQLHRLARLPVAVVGRHRWLLPLGGRLHHRRRRHRRHHHRA